jgi:hypothetical protein
MSFYRRRNAACVNLAQIVVAAGDNVKLGLWE